MKGIRSDQLFADVKQRKLAIRKIGDIQEDTLYMVLTDVGWHPQFEKLMGKRMNVGNLVATIIPKI